MKNFIQYFNESITTDFKIKITGDFNAPKKYLLELIDKTINLKDLIELQNFIDNYISGQDATSILKLSNDNEFYEFYLKYQTDVDEILSNEGFFEKIPAKLPIYSLYNYVVTGSKLAISELLKMLKEDILKD